MSLGPGAYLPSDNAWVDVEDTMQPVETALEAALLVLRNGGSTVAADRSFTNILKGFHQQDVATIWRLDFIAATTRVEDRSSTFLRTVGPIGVNLTRASAVDRAGRRRGEGAVQLAVLEVELERIKRLHSPYNRWLMMVAAAFAAGCFPNFPGATGEVSALPVSLQALGNLSAPSSMPGSSPPLP